MLPELAGRLLAKWSELGLPGERPSKLQFLQVAGPEESAATILLFVFRPGARRPVALAKVRRSPGADEALLREAAVLRSLRELLGKSTGQLCSGQALLPHEVSDSIPRVLDVCEVWAQRALVLEASEGASLGQQIARGWLVRRDARLRRAVRIGMDWLCAFQQATRKADVVVEGELLERHAIGPIRRYSDRLEAGPEKESLARLCDSVGEALHGTPLFLCWRHGDLRPGNILRHRNRLTVVDWEHAEEEALPSLDAALFAASAPAECTYRRGELVDYVSVFRETWLSATPMHDVVVGGLARYATIMGVGAEAVVWGLPIALATRALADRPGADQGRWGECLQLLAEDPGALQRMGEAVSALRGEGTPLTARP
jgi:hypothetical protein